MMIPTCNSECSFALKGAAQPIGSTNPFTRCPSSFPYRSVFSCRRDVGCFLFGLTCKSLLVIAVFFLYLFVIVVVLLMSFFFNGFVFFFFLFKRFLG